MDAVTLDKWKNIKNVGYCDSIMPKRTPDEHEDRNHMKKAQEPKHKSVGTLGAEKARARANAYTDQKREELLRKGLSIIYGGDANAKAHTGRG